MKRIIFRLQQFFLLLLTLKAQGVHAVIFGGAQDPNDPNATDAQVGVDLTGESLEGTGITPQEGDLSDLILAFVNFTLPYLALAAFVGYVYAGVLYVGAFGNEDMINKSKKILIYSTVGLIVVILSFTIVQLFTADLVESVNTQ